MKVLFLSSLSSKYNDNNSSYIHRLVSLKKALESHGVETDLLHTGDFFFSKPAILHPLNIPLMAKRMKGYDFIHAGGCGAAYVAGLAKPFLGRDTKIVYDVHGDTKQEMLLIKDNQGPMFYYLLLQVMIMEAVASRLSDYYIACSDSLKSSLISKGVDPRQMDVITNGVDVDFFRPSDKPYEGDFNVTYAGRFQGWQGISLLADAVRSLKDEKIKLRIIGFQPSDSPYRAKLVRELPDVELIDNMPREKLIDYLRSSGILVIPRLSHPALEVAFPTKFAEYIACGMPVIVTRVGDAAKLTEELNCGLVCEPTAESLSRAILSARDAPTSMLQKMGINGRRYAERELNIKHIGAKYFEFLSSIKKITVK